MMRVKGGKSIVPNVIRVVELARQRGILVIWVFSPLYLLSFFMYIYMDGLVHFCVERT